MKKPHAGERGFSDSMGGGTSDGVEERHHYSRLLAGLYVTHLVSS